MTQLKSYSLGLLSALGLIAVAGASVLGQSLELKIVRYASINKPL